MNQKQKADKSLFMKDGRGPHDLPDLCRTCYGYSNWGGSREDILYEDRDCNNCTNKPEEF